MNPLTGEVVVRIGDQDYTLRFDWAAIAAVQAACGDNPDLTKIETMAVVGALGLRRHHPDMTAERLMELSPPLWPFLQAINQAYQWAYAGNEALPAEDGKKKSGPTGTGLLRRIGLLSDKESTPSNSGV